jgi:Arm DNA-binding domain
MLNDEIIRSRLPGTKQQKLHDEKGLYLLLMPTGAKLWRFKYRFPPRVRDNKENCISLGRYPESH